MKILVYQDYVKNNGVLLKSLSLLGHEAGFIDAVDIKAGRLQAENPALFIMPGGADLYYCEKLNGEGNRLIRTWVEQGGNMLGICAGSYYVSREIMWDKEATIRRIAGQRELNFVPALACGPVRDFIQNGDITKSWQKLVRLELHGALQGLNPHALYWGGPYFTMDETAIAGQDYQVLARYEALENKPPAILSCQVGKGLCISSAVHIEFSAPLYDAWRYADMSSQPEHEQLVAQEMYASKLDNAVLLERVLEIFANRSV